MSFDARAKTRFINLVRRGVRPQVAAEQVGYSWRTVQRHLAQDPKFHQRFLDIEETLDAQVEGVLLEKALDGSLNAIQMWLFNRQGSKWKDRKSIEITGAGGGPIQVASMVSVSLREVLDDPGTRERALGAIRSVEPAVRAPRAIEAHGVPVAPGGSGVGGFLPAPDRPEASEIPERADHGGGD